MFSTCLFCHAALGANESIEHFPVGRRLAYDAAQGRLWVVCKRCTRWNLSPLEERWEALEECERAYRGTRKRVSTDNIALARLADGTDLVRIGRPMLPEFAAWRYGEQLGVRRRRHFLLRTIPSSVRWTTVVAAPILMLSQVYGMGALGVSSIAVVAMQYTGLAFERLTKIPVAHVSVPGVGRLPMRAEDAHRTVASFCNDGILTLEAALRTPRRTVKFLSKTSEHTLTGDDAQRALSDVIVGVNHEGAKADVTADAVRLIEDGATASSLLVSLATPRIASRGSSGGHLLHAPHPQRLALEIALHEEHERRAMAGELGALYARWEEAERTAKIVDTELSGPAAP